MPEHVVGSLTPSRPWPALSPDSAWWDNSLLVPKSVWIRRSVRDLMALCTSPVLCPSTALAHLAIDHFLLQSRHQHPWPTHRHHVFLWAHTSGQIPRITFHGSTQTHLLYEVFINTSPQSPQDKILKLPALYFHKHFPLLCEALALCEDGFWDCPSLPWGCGSLRPGTVLYWPFRGRESVPVSDTDACIQPLALWLPGVCEVSTLGTSLCLIHRIRGKLIPVS